MLMSLNIHVFCAVWHKLSLCRVSASKVKCQNYWQVLPCFPFIWFLSLLLYCFRTQPEQMYDLQDDIYMNKQASIQPGCTRAI